MDPIVNILNNIKLDLLVLLGSLCALMLVIGGIRYVLAQGDMEQIRHAKHTVRNALFGLAVALAAPLLITLVHSLIGS